MKNLERNAQIISEIESKFNVGSLKYHDIDIWPILKLVMYQEIHTNKDSFNSKINNPIFSRALVGYVKKIFVFIHQRIRVRSRFKKTDFLFLTRNENYNEKINNQLFDRHIDPMIDKLKDNYSCSKLKIFTKRDFFQNFYITPYFLSGPKLNKIFINLESFDQNTQRELINISDYYYSSVKKHISFNYVLAYLDTISRSVDYYERILSKFAPKVVFLTCYYSPDNMGLIYACKNLKILTVDIQHGQQGKYHSMYNGWTNKLNASYNLIPDKLWVWGNDTSYYKLGCVIGGNPFKLWNLENSEELESEKLKQFRTNLNNKKKVILFSCSAEPNFDDLIHENVFKAMLNDDELFWIIRLHPNSPKVFYSLMNDKLNELGVVNYELNLSQEFNLISLFLISDVVMVNNSSVCIEALDFDVTVIVVHEHWKIIYQNLINDGSIYFASTVNEMLNLIYKSNKKNNTINYNIQRMNVMFYEGIDSILDLSDNLREKSKITA
jgi:hypothetical protein